MEEARIDFPEKSGWRYTELEEQNIMNKYTFRNIREQEIDQAIVIEQECFPPHEACSAKDMRERILAAPELFFVAEDKTTGKLAGFLTGVSTNEQRFRDEFFTDASLYDPDGETVMLTGLEVLPQHRNQGLGRELMYQYLRREKDKGRKKFILTCLESKVNMYRNWGFEDKGISASTWGDEEWHEMSCEC